MATSIVVTFGQAIPRTSWNSVFVNASPRWFLCHSSTLSVNTTMSGLKKPMSICCIRWVAFASRQYRMILFSWQNTAESSPMCDVCPSENRMDMMLYFLFLEKCVEVGDPIHEGLSHHPTSFRS